MNNCKHENTRIWEPHLAGARKCNDCGWVKNPNRSYSGKPVWFDEDAEIEAREFEKFLELADKYGFKPEEFKQKIMEAILIGPLCDMEKRLDSTINSFLRFNKIQ